MDNKFNRPDKSRLTNGQYFSFMTAISEQLQIAAFTAPAITSRQAALDEQLALIDKYLKIQQGSYLSQDIYNADRRGDLAYGTAHSVVLAWAGKEFQPQAEAAEILNRVFKLYRINTGAQYDEEWGLIGNFLSDIQKPEYAAYIQTLGIGGPLQVLQECYTLMKTLIRQRDDELNGKVKGALVQTRRDCDKAYNDVLNIIEAAALMADDATPYLEFITRWNTALTRYIQQIIDKKGGTSTGTGSSGGTDSPSGTGTSEGSGTDSGSGSGSGTGTGDDTGGGTGTGDNPGTGSGDNPGTGDDPGTGDNPGTNPDPNPGGGGDDPDNGME